MRIFSKAIWSFTLCPIDTGAIPLPATRSLDAAPMIDGHRESVSALSATARGIDDAEQYVPKKLAAPIKVLCDAGRGLQCYPTRILQAAR